MHRERVAELETHTLGTLVDLVGGVDDAGVRTQSYVRTQDNSSVSQGGVTIRPSQSVSQQQCLRIWTSNFGILTPLPSGNGGGVRLSQWCLYRVSDSESQDSVLSLSDSESQDCSSPLESRDTDTDGGLGFLDERPHTTDPPLSPPKSRPQDLIALL